jgi:hypothetical protein
MGIHVGPQSMNLVFSRILDFPITWFQWHGFTNEGLSSFSRTFGNACTVRNWHGFFNYIGRNGLCFVSFCVI